MVQHVPVGPNGLEREVGRAGRCLPNAELVIYPDSGHGGTFQHHRLFVPKALDVHAG